MMLGLGMSILIKETWNSLCFGRIAPKTPWELSSWSTDELYHVTTVQSPTDTSTKLEQKQKIQMHLCWLLPSWGVMENGVTSPLPQRPKHAIEKSCGSAEWLRSISKQVSKGGPGNSNCRTGKASLQMQGTCDQTKSKIPQEVDFTAPGLMLPDVLTGTGS